MERVVEAVCSGETPGITTRALMIVMLETVTVEERETGMEDPGDREEAVQEAGVDTRDQRGSMTGATGAALTERTRGGMEAAGEIRRGNTTRELTEITGNNDDDDDDDDDEHYLSFTHFIVGAIMMLEEMIEREAEERMMKMIEDLTEETETVTDTTEEEEGGESSRSLVTMMTDTPCTRMMTGGLTDTMMMTAGRTEVTADQGHEQDQ